MKGQREIARLTRRAVRTWERMVGYRSTSNLTLYWRASDRLDAVMGELREAVFAARGGEVKR